jgi:N-acyl-D-aspartate/D-glutamate deacylase
MILDGSGAPAFSGDVALAGGSIAAVGKLTDREACHVLDAHGKTLTPGFIDIHRHGDAALFRPNYGKAELKQGLTTVLNGNCGLSAAPVCGSHAPEILRYLSPITGAMPDGREFFSLADYVRQASEVPLLLNVGMLVGAGVLRADVAGYADAPLDSAQLHALHHLLEQALSDGAMGVSLGLGYAPEGFYTAKQLLAALSPLKNSGTVVTVHMRQEGDGVVDALREMITVARALQTPVEISHLKAIGKRNWRAAVPEMLRLIDEARADGVDVRCDVYPYTAGSTQLIHVLPPEMQAGGLAALTARLQNPADRARMRRRMESGTDFENITLLSGFENVLAGSLHQMENREYEGKSIAEIAHLQGKDPYDALFDLLASEGCTVSMIDFIAAEEDIAQILRAPFSSVISDATYPTDGQLHPRVYGMTSHLLERFVRESGVLSLPEAVNRLTRRPAELFGLAKKGRIEVGADADLCLFDPAAIHEAGTYADPRQYAEGMDAVFVGGAPAIRDGAFTGLANGSYLKR